MPHNGFEVHERHQTAIHPREDVFYMNVYMSSFQTAGRKSSLFFNESFNEMG